MTPDAVLDLFQNAVAVAVQCVGPLMAVGVTVGLTMGLIQAATQLSEPALTFVPKMMALAGSLMWFGNWILERLMAFETQVFTSIAGLPHHPW